MARSAEHTEAPCVTQGAYVQIEKPGGHRKPGVLLTSELQFQGWICGKVQTECAGAGLALAEVSHC